MATFTAPVKIEGIGSFAYSDGCFRVNGSDEQVSLFEMLQYILDNLGSGGGGSADGNGIFTAANDGDIIAILSALQNQDFTITGGNNNFNLNGQNAINFSNINSFQAVTGGSGGVKNVLINALGGQGVYQAQAFSAGTYDPGGTAAFTTPRSAGASVTPGQVMQAAAIPLQSEYSLFRMPLNAPPAGVQEMRWTEGVPSWETYSSGGGGGTSISTYEITLAGSKKVQVIGTAGITAAYSSGKFTITIPSGGVLMGGNVRFALADASYTATSTSDGINIEINNSANSIEIQKWMTAHSYLSGSVNAANPMRLMSTPTFGQQNHNDSSGITSTVFNQVQSNMGVDTHGIIKF